MMLPFSLLSIAGMLYFTAFLLHLAAFLGASEGSNRWALVLVRMGFLAHTFFFFVRTKTEGLLIPASNFGEVIAFFSWSLAFVYLVLLAKVQSESFGLILAPLLSLLVGGGLLRFEGGKIPLPSPLHPYFILHLGTAFFAYASFTLSFSASVLYLIQCRELKRKLGGTFYHRLPSLEALEGLIYQPMAWGVSLLMTAIGIGLLWTKSAFGAYWLGEPKTVTTIGIAAFYLALLYFHFIQASRGKRWVVLSLAAFGLVFFNFFGMGLLGRGVHPLTGG